MSGKEIYERLDTVYAALPTDAARQELGLLADVLSTGGVPETRRAVLRWLESHEEL